MIPYDDPEEEFSGYKEDKLDELEKRLPDVVNCEDFSTQPIHKPREIVPGFIDAGQIIAGGGTSKAGKTFLALQLSIACSSGTSFLEAFSPTPVTVLYVGFELSDYRLRQRTLAISKRLSVPPPPKLFIWNLRRKYIDLIDFCQLLSNKIHRVNPALVVVDPMYTLLGNRDENKVTDMTDLMVNLARVQDRTNGEIALCVMHHFPKGNHAQKSLLDCFSGSGAIGRFVDAAFGIRDHESSQDSNRSYIMDFELRDHESIPAFVVDFDFPVFSRNDSKNASKYKVPIGRPENWDDEDLLNILRDAGDCVTSKDFKVLAFEQLGMSRSQFYSRFQKLRDSLKIIVKPVTGFLSIQ